MASDNMKRLESPELYTIAWIAALPIERAAAEAMLDEQHGQPNGFSRNQSDPNSYTWGRIGEHNIVIVSLAAGVYGLGSAAATASSLSSSLPAIRVGLLVGIGGGFSRPDEDHDIRLGDVVVSQPDGTTGGVCQYDLVKAKPGDVRERKGFLASPPRVLLNSLANIQSVHERKDSEIPRFLKDMLEAYPKMAKKTKKNPGYTHQGFENDRLFQPSYGHVTGQDCSGCEAAEEIQREERESTNPEIHYGIIASGNTLVKDAVARDQIIADIGEDCICFEMEAAGLMNHFPCLVIRGICDYSDSHKNDRWQRYASGTAAAYAKELLAYVPAAEIHEAKRALEILESVNEKIGTTNKTTLAVKATVDSMRLHSHGQNLRKWLAAPDPNRNANYARELRHDGTGTWLLGSTAFKEWISGTYKHLWLRGIPGCGKTVLSTTVLDHLIDNGDDRTILNFFFDFSDPMKQTKNGLLRSLAFQLYQGAHDSAGCLDNAFRAHKDGDEKLSTTTLEEIVEVILAAQSKVAIIIDALDESTTREEILLWLRIVFSNPRLEHVQILYTSREGAEFMQSIPDLIGDQCCLFLDTGAIDSDIRSYVTRRTRHDTGFTRKRLSEDLLERIHHKVGNGAKGMFRWAACQLDSLSRCLSPNEIAKTLDRLPTTLEETYDRMLESIPEDYRKSAMRLLQFIVYAKRPLTLKEAVEIVATEVEKERPRFDVDHRVFIDSDILRHCPSLVSVVPVKNEPETIHELHLAHFSVKEYLLNQAIFEPFDASISITKTCLVYLRDIYGRQWRLAEEFPLAEYAAQVWMDFAATAEASEDVSTMMITFLQSEETFQRWIYLHEADQGWAKGPRGSRLYYACVGGLVKVARSIIDAGANVNALRERHCGSALEAASFYGRLDIVRLLLDKGACVNAHCGTYGNALQAACHRGYIDVACLLIEKDAIVNARGGRYGTALQAASRNGHLDIVALLLQKGADVNVQGGEYGNALAAASSCGHLKIIELLLEHNAIVNAPGGFRGNALETASNHGYVGVVKRLLKMGANVHTQSRGYGNALNGACGHGHLELVQLLLNEGADINTEGGFLGNALQAAAYGGNEKIVKMLFDLGADVNATGGQFGSALQAACWGGHEKVVRTLINLGANINAQGGEYGSPLHAACGSRNGKIVKILLEFSVDSGLVVQDYGKILYEACRDDRADVLGRLTDLGVDIAHDSDIDMYLQTACVSGSNHVIESLVGVGANLNARGGTHGSPLQAACRGGSMDTIKFLIKIGADINNGSTFGSALLTAVVEGNESLVEMLIDLGADVNSCGSGSVRSTNSLLAASYVGYNNIVRVLLDNGADVSVRDEDGRTALYAAALSGHTEVAKLLIEAGADVNAAAYDSTWTPVVVASSNGHLKMVDLLLGRSAGESIVPEHGIMPLHYASSKGHVEVVELLLKKGFQISATDKEGWTPLLRASLEGHVKVVRMLLNRGADASVGTAKGWTPLLAASLAGRDKIVSQLFETSRVDLNHQDHMYGRNALSFASEGGHASVVMFLLTKPNIDVDVKDSIGRTAIFYASLEGFADIVNILLSHGASVDMVDHYGTSPLSFAARRGHTKIVRSLLAAGGRSMSRDRFHRTPLWWAKRRGYTEVVKILACNQSEAATTSEYEMDPEVIRISPHISSGKSCDICMFSVPAQYSYYSCLICNGGDFDICEDCFASGGRCLEELHTADLEKGQPKFEPVEKSDRP